jgi:hypothetical protein
VRILHCGILACSVLMVTLGAVGASSSRAAAQEERPQITPGERKAPRKKDAGPRALGVLQMSANGKASFVPIAILINGKFWDASAYKADPVPMALDSGTVYEAEQTGSSLGLFTVNSALHSNAANTQTPWIGTGAWHPNGTDEPKKAAHADNVPVGIDTEDQPPRLTHNQAKGGPAEKSAPSSGKDTGSGTGPNSTSAPSSDTKKSDSSGSSGNSGDEPPRLSKGSPPATPPAGSGNPNGTQNSPNSSAPPTSTPSAPGDPKVKDAKPEQAKVPASDSGADDANRPRLRRGKPAESFADEEEIAGYSRPGASAGASVANPGKVVQTGATQGDVKLIPAISDAGGPPPHSFAFEWVKGDEEDRRKQMMDLAKQQVRAYIAAQAKNRITPKPAHPAATHRAALVEPIFENVQMRAYDLWNSNQPIIVFSADAHMPPPAAGTAHSEVDSETQYSILLVTYPDIYNNLRKLYSGVTDKFHLDVTPRLELVDVVDADGDGRGELLFRETSDAGTGWAIYRATADKLWKMYDSLNPL